MLTNWFPKFSPSSVRGLFGGQRLTTIMLTAADAATMSLCVHRKECKQKGGRGRIFQEGRGPSHSSTKHNPQTGGAQEQSRQGCSARVNCRPKQNPSGTHQAKQKRTAFRWFPSILGAGSFPEMFRFRSNSETHPFVTEKPWFLVVGGTLTTCPVACPVACPLRCPLRCPLTCPVRRPL